MNSRKNINSTIKCVCRESVVSPMWLPCNSHSAPILWNGLTTDLKRIGSGPEANERYFSREFCERGVHFCRFYGYNILEIKPKRKRAPPSLWSVPQKGIFRGGTRNVNYWQSICKMAKIGKSAPPLFKNSRENFYNVPQRLLNQKVLRASWYAP